MKSSLLTVSALVGSTLAFPNLPVEVWEALAQRQIPGISPGLSKAEGNCGPRLPCPTFNEKDQFVSTTGQYAYVNPKTGQIRGPCPGLNAAANHGYLPRDGVASILETITGMALLFNMSPDLSGFLAAYAVVMDGDIISQTWSIGGPPPYNDPTGLLTPPQGISFSHNKYEGDTSIGRNDAYLADGDAYSLNVTRFGYAYKRGQADGSDRYTLDKFRQDHGDNIQRSIKNNPFYFAPLFSTTLVAPAAYNFVINFMSNHSAEEPNGYLDGAQFKEWFAVRGAYRPRQEKNGYGFRWAAGKERIPKNWYRRPSYNQYNAADVFLDLGIGWAAYPDTFRLGGNTNGVNTYKGVDIATLTGGTFNNGNIRDPINFQCLLFQAQQQFIPDQLKGGINAIAGSLALIDKYSGFLKNLACPQLSKYDSSLFNQYPGRTYNPKAPCTTVGC